MNNEVADNDMTSNTIKERKPPLRFPEFSEMNGWTYERLGVLAKRVTCRNTDRKFTRVLTNSAEHGVVDQRDFFDREIVTSENLDTYYIVEAGDYVYNPRVSKSAPVGPISKNHVGTGVMSPLYTVFRFHETDNDFYEYYFQSSHWHRFLRDASNSGARHDRMNISTEDFMSMLVPVPPRPDEKAKVARFLSTLDELIDAEARKLERLQTQREGFLQQLFPNSEGK
jgi:type I restriction enzyme S subunit